MKYQSLNPATEELLKEYPLHGDDAVDKALEKAALTFSTWRRRSLDQRAERLRQAAGLLEGRAAEWGRLMAAEMGKPVTQGEGEANKCATACRYYADHGAAFLAHDSRESDGSEAFVRHDPLGPILAIMPWNFPFWQVFRFAAPALMAGNTVVLKHAPNTPGCAAAIESIMLEAGFPEGALLNLYITNEQAARVIADERIQGVTLTGSTRAGKQVAGAAGRNLKTMVMELGGSDPFIVLEDADLDTAVKTAVLARCQNSGQSCIAAKRFLIHRSRYDAFRDAFVAAMEAQKVGDPLAAGTHLGPMARKDLRDGLATQVAESVAAGARCTTGGKAPEGKGFYYLPTVLEDIPETAPAYDEELFGPVASLYAFDTEDEALELANGTNFGLGASLWTADLERGKRLAGEIEAGAVFINGLVKSDPRLPFGGIKESGFGRELSVEGMREFVNLKTVWIR